LHIDDLGMVINFDLPADPENYVHRIGRTARAGKSGRAVSLACDRFVYGLEAIEEYIKAKLPIVWPESDLFVEDKSAGQRLNIERAARKDNRARFDNRRGRAGTAHSAGKRSAPESSERRKSTQAPGKQRAGTDRKNNARNKTLGEMNEQERLAYYRDKYGESFTPSEKKPAPGQGAAGVRRKKRPRRRKPSLQADAGLQESAVQRKPPISADYGVPKKSMFRKIADLFKG
jgi:ATP-dependent RNA helicase RhlB